MCSSTPNRVVNMLREVSRCGDRRVREDMYVLVGSLVSGAENYIVDVLSGDTVGSVFLERDDTTVTVTITSDEFVMHVQSTDGVHEYRVHGSRDMTSLSKEVLNRLWNYRFLATGDVNYALEFLRIRCGEIEELTLILDVIRTLSDDGLVENVVARVDDGCAIGAVFHRIGTVSTAFITDNCDSKHILTVQYHLEGKTPSDDVVKFPLHGTADELIEALVEGIEQTIEDYEHA